MMIFPEFNPIAVQLGPVAVHWYGLAYVAALLGGLALAKALAARRGVAGITPHTVDDFFIWMVAGVIAGGRLGYVLFYNPGHYMANPAEILQVWHGGMSFHGGVAGVAVAMAMFAWKRGLNVLALADTIAPVVPLGCFLGRIANFINGELVGRAASPNLPWAMVFPHIDGLPRHPSQLYQAGLEGLVLGALMAVAVARGPHKRGALAGLFLVGYALARLVGEQFRTPEITYLGGFFTQGMLLSVPMALGGLWLLMRRTSSPQTQTK